MRNKPRIRFKGFTEDWEQRKLSDITEIVMGQSPSSKNYTDNPNDNILVQGNADLKDGKVVPRLWTKEITKTIDKDGIILTVRAPVGDVARTDYKVVLGRGVAGIKGNDYIYQFLQKLQNNRYWVSLSSGSTFESINSNDIKDLIIDIPSVEEQTKISMLLNNVNSIITLHQRKLEKLKLAKKALLQKLFPKNGSQFPEIRFKGFTDAWEQRKLLTVLNKIVDYRGRTPKKLGLDWSPTGHLALSALNVKMGYIDKTVDAHYGDDHLYSVWMKDNDIYEGQVLFTTEAPMGNVAQVPDDNKYILSQRTIAFVPDRSVISDNFLAVVLSASKCQKSLTNRASGGTAKGVSQKTLSEISLDIPKSLSEQDKVSELIKKLSKVITLHQ